MHAPRPILSEHRTARLIAWALSVLTWIARGLFHGTEADHRRPRQRDWFLDPDNLARLVRDLILLRASKLAAPRPVQRKPGRGAPARNIHLRRAAAGSRLRRALDHRDPIQRVARLIQALRNIEHHACEIARRLKRRLTRLAPQLAAPRAADVLRVLANPAPFAADSS